MRVELFASHFMQATMSLVNIKALRGDMDLFKSDGSCLMGWYSHVNGAMTVADTFDEVVTQLSALTSRGYYLDYKMVMDGHLVAVFKHDDTEEGGMLAPIGLAVGKALYGQVFVLKRDICFGCKKPATKSCSVCKIIPLCSSECAKKTWKLHKRFCMKPKRDAPDGSA